jgi:hypothetical protein
MIGQSDTLSAWPIFGFAPSADRDMTTPNQHA